MTDQSVSKREQIAALSNALRDDEREAAADFVRFMVDGEGKVFADAVKAYRERSVPGEPFDSQMNNILSILGNAEITARDRARPAPTDENPFGNLPAGALAERTK